MRFLALPVVILAAAASSSLVWIDVAHAQDVAAGGAIAERMCGRCHAVGRTGPSPHAVAPPFRDLAQRYSLSGLEEALAEGIVVGHPDMPQFTLQPAEIDDLLAYMDSLTRAGDKPN